MKIATILFTYNRSNHTQKVVNALRNGYELPEKMFVFQDGLKAEKHRVEWDRVNRIITGIDFCSTEVIVSNVNKGLARSIMDGITYVSDRYDAFIVLEDDCLPDRNFMGFMKQGLNKYLYEKKVYAVTGYGYGKPYEKSGYDAYFVGRISSWGWASWSDRWKEFVPNDQDLYDMLNNKDKSIHLATWGNDLEKGLFYQKNGMTDSWALYWALHVMNRSGFCLAPNYSLIDNIGFDGTGVHSGVTDEFAVSLENAEKKEYKLPDKIEFNYDAAAYFYKHYGGYLATRMGEGRDDIVIYGIGTWFSINEELLSNSIKVRKFIDKKRRGFYAGIPIFNIEEYEYDGETIIVSLISVLDGLNVKKELIQKKGIPSEHILVLGIDAIDIFDEE